MIARLSHSEAANGMAPLSVLIKRDEMKDRKKKRLREIEQTQMQSKKDYESFIKNRNAQFAQKVQREIL
jgi:deoxyadenosine/deoxycytidine kinase